MKEIILNNIVVMAIGQLSVMSTIFWRLPVQPREKPSVRDPAKAIKYDVHCFLMWLYVTSHTDIMYNIYPYSLSVSHRNIYFNALLL